MKTNEAPERVFVGEDTTEMMKTFGAGVYTRHLATERRFDDEVEYVRADLAAKMAQDKVKDVLENVVAMLRGEYNATDAMTSDVMNEYYKHLLNQHPNT